jgi:hypothetical protein
MDMSESTLNFQWSLGTLAISIIALVVVCGLSLLTCVRSGFRRPIVLLEASRVVIVTLATILLNAPEWIEKFIPTQQPTIVVLGDASKSMSTRDVGLGDTTSSVLKSREESIAGLMQAEAWKSVKDDFQVVITPFSSGDANLQSDLHAALSAAREDHPNLRAVVLASDGDWNTGPPPVQMAMRYRLDKIPIFSVPVGSQSRLPDVELLSFDVPTFGVVNKTVRVPFTIESSMPRDHVAQVTMTTAEGVKVTREVRVAAMGRTTDAILWKPEQVGDFTLTLSIPNHPEERLTQNNTKTAPIAIREEKLRVLVIESLPRWEYRYLRNALSRDPGVEVSCLLFHPALSKVGGGNRDYIQAFPDALEVLSQYDVVFLGDVGIADGQLTEEQCRLLKGLVEQQASGLVFMPGWQGKQLSLIGSPLDPLIPVVYDDSQKNGWGSRTPSHFALTELGRRSLLTKLADTQDDNMQVWENLPGFQWHAAVTRAKAGSDVLAVHQESANEYGRVPLLATRTFGAGKVLFMGTDGAWRWRRGVEDLYHYRFWGQVVRWMAYQRNMAKGESMRFYYSPEQPQIRQTVSLSTNVMEKNGEPLSKGDVTVRISAPSGRVETIALTSSGEEWGAFTSAFTPKEAGQHQITVKCKQNDATLETKLFVQGATVEQIGKPSRPEVLDELARVSQGKVLRNVEVEEIVRAIQDLPTPQPKIRRVQLWSHPLIAATLVTMLGVFWAMRKVVGLI